MTVDDNKKRFQRREVAKAEEARELMRKLGYPSEKDMFQMVKSGALLNSPVTAQDIRNARAIFGADEASLKGKKKRKPSVIVDSEFLTTQEMPRQKLSMLMDIFFVDGDPFLLTLTKPMEHLMVTPLSSRKMSELLRPEATKNHIAKYRGAGFDVTNLQFDGEGGLAACTQDFKEILHLNATGPEQHVGAIVVKIKQVKERIRCHWNILPFKLSRQLLKYLVMFCVSRVNMVVSSLWETGTTDRESA